MKAILKGVRQDCNFDYKDTFNSSKNLEIRDELIEELRKAMVPKFCPLINQLTKWLSSIHKSRRSQKKLKLTRKISDDYCRIHSNSRLNDVCNSLNN